MEETPEPRTRKEEKGFEPDSAWRPPRKRRNPFWTLIVYLFSSFYLFFRIIFLGALVFVLTASASYIVVRHEIKGKEVVVPNLAGYTVLEAMQLLQKNAPELALKLEGMEYNSMVNEGEISWQTPPAGSHVKSASGLRIKVSRGNTMVTCPDLTGSNVQDAGMTLRHFGLAEGTKAFVADAKVKKDFIISQDPPPGADVAKQTPVNLMISKGAPVAVLHMPDLMNPARDIVEAKDTLHVLGLSMPQVSEMPYPGVANGKIVRQSPAPGSVVTPQDPISVTVVNNLGASDAPPPPESAVPSPEEVSPAPGAPSSSTPSVEEDLVPDELPNL